jgi:two-component system, chemotaxis family, protein-glutamate methylesterase/glutaminase
MSGHDIIAIGASAGGVEALKELVSGLPADLPAVIFVVLHVSAHGTSVLPHILSRAGELPAHHAYDGQVFKPGNIYVAPPNHHLLVKPGHIHLNQGPKENGHRPAVDVLFRTSARAYGSRVIGVVLSGVLDDGSAGTLSIKHNKGIVVVQDPADAMYAGMPQSTIEADHPDYVVPVSEMASLLTQLTHKEIPEEVDVKDENDITELDKDADLVPEPGGTPTTYVCPDCGGVMMEYHDGQLFRFRCQVGHAYSAVSLIAAQSEALEDALWMALRALQENAKLTRRLADRAEARGYRESRDAYLEKVDEIETNADVIRKILMNGDIVIPIKPEE